MKRFLIILTITVLLLAQVAAARAESSSTPDFSAIDSFIQNEMQATHVPGLALAIVHKDEVVYLKGYGIADDSGTPVTPQTPFMLASVSKPFVSPAVMQLVEAGKVDLDAPVQTYLPWFRVADEAASAQITVRMLLNHTSGIPGSAGMEYFASDADLETQVHALANVELDRPVGESYEYANPTYATLALIVQETSGEPFESYLQNHIFNPLEMSDSFASKDEAANDGLATGHTFALGQPIGLDVPYNRGGVPYCCIISSAEDLSHFLIMQMNGGEYKSSAILSSEGIAMMHAPAVQEDRPERYYGMAWETRPVNGVAAVMHTGEGIGWQANLIMLEDGWGIVVLANGYDFVDNTFGAGRILGIARGVTSLVVGQKPPQAESGSGAIVFYGVLSAIWLIQFFGMVRTVRLIKRGKDTKKFTGVYLPLLANLLWGGVMIFVVPNVLMPFSLMKLLAPVLAYTLLASGVTAFVWALVRTILVTRPAHKTI